MTSQDRPLSSPYRRNLWNNHQQPTRQQQQQMNEGPDEQPVVGRSMWRKLFGRWKLKYKHGGDVEVSNDVTVEAAPKKTTKSILSALVRSSVMAHTRR